MVSVSGFRSPFQIEVHTGVHFPVHLKLDSMTVVQITQTHLHVMSDRVRHRNRQAEAQDAMDNPSA